MRRERTIEILNGLIKVNNERIGCYERAAKETRETELRSLFDELRNCGVHCKEQLISEVLKSGGQPVSDPNENELKELPFDITDVDNNSILGTCELKEDNAADKYYQTLRDHVREITPEQQGLVNTQFAMIRANLTKLSDSQMWRSS